MPSVHPPREPSVLMYSSSYCSPFIPGWSQFCLKSQKLTLIYVFFQMSPSQMAFSGRERWRAMNGFSLSSSLLLPFSALPDPFLIFFLISFSPFLLAVYLLFLSISSLFSHNCSWLCIYHCLCVSLKKKKEIDTSVTKQDPSLAFMFGNHILEYSSWSIGLNYLCFSVYISVCSRLYI